MNQDKRMLVIGANGFLGSHVTRLLRMDGHPVRVLIRRNCDERALAGLELERVYGDIFDDGALREAMRGVAAVFYCVVDTRAWLLDPAPLFRTNVEGLRQVLDVAVELGVPRFVFTSSIGTIGRSATRPANEDDPCAWADLGGPYIHSRVQAEQLVLRYCRERGLNGVAMCVANTYGPGDWGMTPHGLPVAAAAKGEMPFYITRVRSETVGVEDAARALILAAQRGRVGERYIVSERSLSAREIGEVAARATGARPPRLPLPLGLLYAIAWANRASQLIRRRDIRMIPTSVRLMHIMSPLDHGKAVRELGWQPRPVQEAIAAAARFYVEN